ncbi:hypothetical protein P376_3775 [Streptomyces sp. HCCB10043]|nr:hypothetical protein P376_3775 [Streptomyces sp. HCCB10043]
MDGGALNDVLRDFRRVDRGDPGRALGDQPGRADGGGHGNLGGLDGGRSRSRPLVRRMVRRLGGGVVRRAGLQGDLLDEDRHDEGDERARSGVQEDVADAVPVRGLHDHAERLGQLVQVGDAPAAGAAVAELGALGAERGEAVLDVLGDPVAEDRAERRDADGTAEGAEEGDDGAGGTEVLGSDLVLRGEDQVLHHHADAETHDEHEDRDVPVRGVVPDRAQQPEPGRDQEAAADQPCLPAPGLGDDLAGDRRGEEEPRDHRDGHDAGHRRRLAARQLEVLAEEDGAREHRDADEQRGDRGQRDGAVTEEAQRNDGFLGPRLDEHEDQAEQDRARDHDVRLPRQPVVLVAREGHPDQQQGDGGADEERAGPVDLDALALHDRELQGLLEHDQRDDRERHADVEAPAPAHPAGVGDDAAEQRAADGGDGEDRAQVAAVAAALARGDHRGHDDLREGGETADADALDDAAGDEHAAAGRQTGDDRAQDVDDQGYLNQQLLAEEVGELAPERGGGGHGQQRGRHDPGVGALAAAEVGDDLGQGVGDDRRRQDRDEHAEQQPGQRLHDLPVCHRRAVGGAGGVAAAVPSVLGVAAPHTGGCGRSH